LCEFSHKPKIAGASLVEEAAVRMKFMTATAPASECFQQLRVLSPVLCPLGFVHGYRCAGCSWTLLFPDCHVSWSIPFCYQVQAQKAFATHRCGESTSMKQDCACELCCDLLVQKAVD